MTATAGGSPSGIAEIKCAVDHGGTRAYSGSRARVAVSGVGSHAVVCIAENKAVNPAGNHAVSQSVTWNLTIRRPTAMTAVFAHAASHRTVYTRTEHIHFGARTTVSGRLTLRGGTGLAGQTVHVLSCTEQPLWQL